MLLDSILLIHMRCLGLGFSDQGLGITRHNLFSPWPTPIPSSQVLAGKWEGTLFGYPKQHAIEIHSIVVFVLPVILFLGPVI